MARQKSTPVACKICGRVINREADMARHLLIHAENKEDNMYHCEQYGCQYKTLQVSNLRTHSRIHTGERPFECHAPGCNFRTAHARSLSRHHERKHNDTSNENAESLRQPSDSQSTTRGQKRFAPYPQHPGKENKRDQVRDTYFATTPREDRAPLASGSGRSTTSTVAAAEHPPADSRSITRRQRMPSPHPYQSVEGSKHAHAIDLHLATTSRLNHAPLASVPGASTASRVIATAHQPLPEQAGLYTPDAATPTDSNGLFDDLDSLFSEWFPGLAPSMSGSSHSSLPVSNEAASVNTGPSLSFPMVQHPVVDTNSPLSSSISPTLSDINNSLLSPSPVRSYEMDGVPMPIPSLSPSYELQDSANYQPAPPQESRILPAYEAQYPPSIYGENDGATAARSPVTQSVPSRPSLFATPDTSIAQPRAVHPHFFFGVDQSYLGQSRLYTTTTTPATTNTTNSSASTSGGSGTQGLYLW